MQDIFHEIKHMIIWNGIRIFRTNDISILTHYVLSMHTLFYLHHNNYVLPNINNKRLMLNNNRVHTKNAKRQYMSVHILYDVLTLSCKLFPLKAIHSMMVFFDRHLSFFHLQQTVKTVCIWKINLNVFASQAGLNVTIIFLRVQN